MYAVSASTTRLKDDACQKKQKIISSSYERNAFDALRGMKLNCTHISHVKWSQIKIIIIFGQWNLHVHHSRHERTSHRAPKVLSNCAILFLSTNTMMEKHSADSELVRGFLDLDKEHASFAGRILKRSDMIIISSSFFPSLVSSSVFSFMILISAVHLNCSNCFDA